jgi:ubiquinone/menaquinone biosynthesis C-methylase UbiE
MTLTQGTKSRNEAARMTVKDANEQARGLWDRYAPRYDRHIRLTERLLFPNGRSWSCAQASGDVLEVAVGTGLNLPWYSKGITLTGIDLSPAMLAIARDRARTLGMKADLREASADALPFPDDSFDTVLCTVSLCNISADRAAIGEMHRVLRPGGRLVLLDHVASDRRWVLAIERLLEPLFLRMNGDYLTRRPLPLVEAVGFAITGSQRSKAGIIERLTAVKPLSGS